MDNIRQRLVLKSLVECLYVAICVKAEHSALQWLLWNVKGWAAWCSVAVIKLQVARVIESITDMPVCVYVWVGGI